MTEKRVSWSAGIEVREEVHKTVERAESTENPIYLETDKESEPQSRSPRFTREICYFFNFFETFCFYYFFIIIIFFCEECLGVAVSRRV